MRKPNSNSLYGRLTRAEKLDEFYAAVYGQALGIKELVALCEGWGLATSAGAVCQEIQNHGMVWKIKAANERAELRQGVLPEDADAKIVEARRQIEFDLAYTDLSTAERLKLLTHFESKRSLDLETEKYRSSVQSDIDRALEAFKNELQANAAALAAFEEFRAKVKAALEKKAA